MNTRRPSRTRTWWLPLSLCAAVVAALPGRTAIAQQTFTGTVTIQHSLPKLELVDNVGTTETWNLSGNHTGFSIGNIGNPALFIESAAPGHSLSIDSTGNIGFGSSPDTGVDLDIKSSGFPQIQLHAQNGNDDRWYIAGGSTFTVANATGGFGATFPLLIDRSAPNESIHVTSAGNVGLGTATTSFPLHVVRFNGVAPRIAQFSQTKSNGVVLVGYENLAAASLTNEAGFDFVLRTSAQARVGARIIAGFTNISDASRQGQMRFLAADGGAFVEAFRVRGNKLGVGQVNPTQLLHVGNATCNGTTWADASSRALKHDVADLSVDAARDAVLALRPVTYAYNQAPGVPRVGFIAEEVPDLVALPGRETLSSLDVVAALTRVVQDQESRLARQDRTIEALEQRLQALESRGE